jgi:uncharacterized protein
MDALLSHAQTIEKVNDFIDQYQSDLSYAHGTDHVRRVARLAVKIGTIEKADCQLIEVAALLHDIGIVPLAWTKRAMGKDENDFLDFMGSYVINSKEHGEVGAIIARRFLQQIGYPDNKTDIVAKIIREHPALKQTSPESSIVADADKLEILGATWIARAFQRTSAFDRHFGIESIPLKYLVEKKNIQPEFFYSQTAREMAVRRQKFLVSFLEQFQREMDMEV